MANQPNDSTSRAANTIREIFDSGRPLTYIRTAEERRVGKLLQAVSAGLDAATPVWQWTLTEGMRAGDVRHAGTESPRAVLDLIASHPGNTIFLLKDFHEPLRESPEIRRRLRDIYENCRDQRKYVVITSPVRYIPEELERSIMFLELRPPDIVELVQLVREEAPVLAPASIDGLSGTTLEQLARALMGLTLDEAGYALRRALSASPRLGPDSVPHLLEEKRVLVSRSGVIDYVSDGTNLGEVGGLEGLKKWLIDRQRLFQMRDQLTNEIVPKGLLMMGIPGCGKSLCVKAIASCFQLPLYRVDMIEIFSGRHGKPEGVFVEACKMMEEMAPAVLWFDEIEMGVTSAESGGEQGRIFAFFLTWMQEKTRGLFVAATANRIDLLPAEMIRKGRFDEVFFVDLPNDEERVEIFRIHLQRRGVDPSAFQLSNLVSFTVGWTGAEIEQCVVSAMTQARLAEREVAEDDLIKVSVKIVPLSRTMKEQINHIRGWAFERAVRASNPAR